MLVKSAPCRQQKLGRVFCGYLTQDKGRHGHTGMLEHAIGASCTLNVLKLGSEGFMLTAILAVASCSTCAKHASGCQGKRDYVYACDHRTVYHAGNGNPADGAERKWLPNFFSDPLGFTTFLLSTVPYRIGCSLIRAVKWLLGLKIDNNNHAFVNYSQVRLSYLDTGPRAYMPRKRTQAP